MATAAKKMQVVGVKVELSTAEAIALVNTLDRIGSIVDDNDRATPSGSVDWEALCSAFLDGQGREEAEAAFGISRVVGSMIEYDPVVAR
jgi:hypothetical protein